MGVLNGESRCIYLSAFVYSEMICGVKCIMSITKTWTQCITYSLSINTLNSYCIESLNMSVCVCV